MGLACLGAICGFGVASLRCGVFGLVWLDVVCDLVGLVGLPVVLWVGGGGCVFDFVIGA